MIDHQKTFVLAYRWLFQQRSMGTLVSEFEKLNLNITEMRSMVVTQDFAWRHLANIKVDPEAFYESIPSPFVNWVDCIASGPVTAMIVEGDDAVHKVRDLSKKQRRPFQVVETQTVYSSDSHGERTEEEIELWQLWKATFYTSDSGDQAKIDIGLWFGSTDFDGTIDFEKRAQESTKVVFVLPGGKTYGPLDQVIDAWKLDASCKIHEDFKDNFFMEDMCVLLIKPLAFDKHCVGEILDAIEANCLVLKGLKLVKKAKHPSKAWDADSVSYGDGYGVAVVVSDLESSFKIVPGNSKNIDFRNRSCEIGSDYLYKSEQGEEVLEAASDFFDYGFNVWAFENDWMVHGRIFAASLVGLTSLLN